MVEPWQQALIDQSVASIRNWVDDACAGMRKLVATHGREEALSIAIAVVADTYTAKQMARCMGGLLLALAEHHDGETARDEYPG